MVLCCHRWCFACVIALVTFSTAVAQEAPSEAKQTAEEKTYFDLRRSNDRVTRMIADRYFNLVKPQEWSDVTGKSKVTAKYLEHDPDLEWVKLQAVRGRGAERVVKEIKVPVAKLSKVCQSRVRQINALQRKLDELLAAANEEDAPDVGGEAFADPGAPMVDERGVEPGPTGRERFDAPADVSPESPAAPSNPEPAEFEEDPLGFAEMELGPPPQGLAGGGPSIPGMPLLPAGQPGANIDRQQWPISYAAFHANFTVVRDERGEQKIDWGELDELRTIGEGLTGEQALGPSGQPRTESSERLPNVQWEATFQSFLPAERGMRMAFDLPPLLPPLEIEFRLDETRLTPDDWNQVSANAGNRVSFTGRLAMAGPTSIVVFVRDPKPATPGPQH
jgi:hypothetical protein